MICLLHPSDTHCWECDYDMRYVDGPIFDGITGPFCSTDCLEGYQDRSARLFVSRIRCANCGLLGSLDGCMCPGGTPRP